MKDPTIQELNAILAAQTVEINKLTTELIASEKACIEFAKTLEGMETERDEMEGRILDLDQERINNLPPGLPSF